MRRQVARGGAGDRLPVTGNRFASVRGVVAAGLRRLAAALLVGFAAGPATAASQVVEEGATLRLVALPPEADGRIRGALEIDLEPGWKTYWISPGPVGLAPSLDFTGSAGIAGVEARYPAPVRFAEGDASSVGYDGPVAFALEGHVTGDAHPVLRVEATIGICRELCVPLQASLETAPDPGLSARGAVRAATDALPAEASADGMTAHLDADDRTLRLAIPRQDVADLFVVDPPGWRFGTPRREASSTFVVDATPAGPASVAPETLTILLTGPDGAHFLRAVPILPR